MAETTVAINTSSKNGSVNLSRVGGNSFNHLFDKVPDYKKIKNVEGYGCHASKLHYSNMVWPYYYRSGYGVGNSHAVLINNKDDSVAWKWSDKAFLATLTARFAWGTTLVNCVGWAHGRFREVCVLGGLSDPNYLIPSCHAVYFYDYWPSSEGWSKSNDTTTESRNSARPAPGSIIVWEKVGDFSPGHVAFVEAVHNLGQDDEYIVISESGANQSWFNRGARCDIIRRSDKTQGVQYAWSSCMKFRGFLYGPACTVASDYPLYKRVIDGSYGNIQKIEISTSDITQEDKEKYQSTMEALSGNGTAAVSELNTDQHVKALWLGKTSCDGGKNKNLFKCDLIVAEIDHDKDYPYVVTVAGGNGTKYFFKREWLSSV